VAVQTSSVLVRVPLTAAAATGSPQIAGTMHPSRSTHDHARPDGEDRLSEELRTEARRIGFSRVGVAPATRPPHHGVFREWLTAGLGGVMTPWLERHEPLRADPTALLPGARSIIMLATDHATGSSGVGGTGQGRGRLARYAWGDDYHDLLRDRGTRLGAWLEARVPGARARAVVDSAPLAERDFAWLAGLGWFGKNTMLIDPRAGSYFLLTAIVTDIALPIDVAVDVDHCGTCTACLDACPTGALPAPRVLDANRCISALTIEHHGAIEEPLRVPVGDWIFGCDVCQEVCPWNRHAPGSPDVAFQPRGGEETLDLVEVLALDEAAFRHRFRGSPVLRAKRRGLVRSAAIALGNSPRSAAFAVLARILDDAEAVVRGAAAWALGQWGAAGVEAGPASAALRDRLAVENDADVRREIERALVTASRPSSGGDATTGPAG